MRRYARSVVLFGIATALSLSSPALAGYFTVQVVDITDGDTIVVRNGNGVGAIRLTGIDAPEHGQPFGLEAQDHLRALSVPTPRKDAILRLVHGKERQRAANSGNRGVSAVSSRLRLGRLTQLPGDRRSVVSEAA